MAERVESRLGFVVTRSRWMAVDGGGGPRDGLINARRTREGK